MIYIYCDFDRFESVQPSEYTWVAEQVGEYISLRQKLRRALDDEEHDFTVYLRSPVLAEWLRDLRDYGERVVVWQTVDLRRRFQSRFGFPAPDEIDSSAIQVLDLLSLTPPGHTAVDDPTGWLLSQCLGTVWEMAEPYPEHLADLAAWAADAGELHPALHRLAENRLRHWCHSDDRYSCFLRNDWQHAGQSVLLHGALSRYQPSFVNSLGLAEAPLVDIARHASACASLLEAHQAELRRYWSLFFAGAEGSLPDILEQALSQMSGLAQAELLALCDYTGDRATELSQPLLNMVRAHFRLLPNTQATLARLERRVPPPTPAEPDGEWEPSRWLSWATDEYLPYFAWAVRNKQPRQEQIRLADRFSDWLVGHYASLIFDPQSLLLLTQHSYVRQIAKEEPDGVLFWVIVDGLTWWQGKLLAGVCEDNNLHIHRLEPMLSTLPSITSVSKRALAMGYLGTSERQQPIAKILQERLPQIYGHVDVFSEPGDLTAALETNVQPGIYVLLYNALDTHNHESRTFTDDESAKGYLRAVVANLSEVVGRVRQRGLEARILISSDHGSTLLPRDAATLKPPAFIQELDDEDEWMTSVDPKRADYQRTRAYGLTRELTPEEISRLKEQWYILGKAEFGLTETLLIPRGYACVKRRPRGWTHGGATPEETVVPFVELRPRPLEVWQPELCFEGYLLPNRPSTIAIKITNPNPFPLAGINIIAWDGRLTTTLPRLAAGEAARLDVCAPAALESAQRIVFNWSLLCEVTGSSHKFAGEASLPVRRLQISQVDELFEEMS